MADATKKNGMATAALVLGIISIPTGFMGWLGIICGILAIIFAVVAKGKIKSDPELAHTAGSAKGGMITGIIGVVIGIVVIVLVLMAVAALGDSVLDAADADSFKDMMKDLNNN